MKGYLKQLGKDSIAYGVGGILAKAMIFLLMPVYTRIFSPADYGTITMLTVLTSFLGAVLTMGMGATQTFYFFEQKKEGNVAQARVITAIFQWRLTWGLILVGGAFLLSPILNRQFFDGQLTWLYFALAFAGCFFLNLYRQSTGLFRLRYRPWSYITLMIGHTLLSATIALVLILGFDWGILGFVTGTTTGTCCMALVGWQMNRSYLDWSRWHREWWPRIVRFGAPLVPAELAMYVLNTSDRWFISHYHGQDELGLYAVGANFAMILALAVVTFRQAWWPIAMDAMHSDDGPALFREIARLYMGLGTAGVVLLTAFSPLLVRWFTGPAFHAAYPIVGILAWHSLFYGAYLIIVAGIWKREKTAFISLLMGIAAFLNIGLDALLVPQYGSIGAAAATSFSFLFWNILTIWLSERLWRVNYPYHILIVQICVGVTGSILILYLYTMRQAWWMIVFVTFLAGSLSGCLSVSRKNIKTLLNKL
ncbi:MAG: oligosaccharide flippase family protein [Deltaproteobacteria bacterium]|nr:oligosaccharide flippase family protein [Deltaproteobacteria bacterium]